MAQDRWGRLLSMGLTPRGFVLKENPEYGTHLSHSNVVGGKGELRLEDECFPSFENDLHGHKQILSKVAAVWIT